MRQQQVQLLLTLDGLVICRIASNALWQQLQQASIRPPEQVTATPASYTGRYLALYLEGKKV